MVCGIYHDRPGGSPRHELATQPSATALRVLGRLAGACLDERERARGVLRVMLVELGELEPDGLVVDGRSAERLEVGQRSRLVAAGLRDLGTHARSGVPG